MASRLFARGGMYGLTELYECTVGAWDFTPTEKQVETYMDALRAFIHDKLKCLDDRLWWQPETSEIFWEDDGSGKELPDEFELENWWKETVSDAYEHTDIPDA